MKTLLPYDAQLQPDLKKPRIEFDEFAYSQTTDFSKCEESKESLNVHELNVDLFKTSMNKFPRPAQEDLLEFVHEQVAKEKLFVVDLPTGGGKSAVAGFAGAVAITHHKKKRMVYITSSKSLQKQVVHDAKTWNLFESKKTVVCQLGKGNYFCPKRLALLMNRSPTDPKNIQNICNGPPKSSNPFNTTSNSIHSQKFTKAIHAQLTIMKAIDISKLGIHDDFYTTSYREHFYDTLRTQQVPDGIISLVWDEVSASGGNAKDKTACSCRGEVACKFKEGDGNINVFLAKHLKCGYCKIRALSKICGVLVTNMDAVFSYVGHAELKHLINPDDFVVFDEAHNICKRAQELFESETQRTMDAKKIEESLKKWSSAKANLCSGSLDHKVFFDFPEQDRSVLTFNNRNFASYYGKVYEALLNLDTNKDMPFESRKKIVENLKSVVDAFSEEEKEFETIYGIEDLRAKIGHACNVMGLKIEKAEEISEETCKVTQRVLGEPEGCDITNNKNKALYYLQEELVEAETFKSNNPFLKECYKLYEKGDKTLDHFYNTVREAHKCLTDIEISKYALSKGDWINDKKLCETWVPKISKIGIGYDLTFMKKAEILKEKMWNKLTQGAMFMSATVSHPEKDPEYAFEDFFTETGLPEETVCHTTKEVFDSNRITIYVPPMMKYSYNSGFEAKKMYNQERVKYLSDAVKMNPLATLVLSNNLEDYKGIIYSMKKTLRTHKHVDYNTEQGLFKEFEDGKHNNYVIYGAEKLWTGLNLPGRIGMVVVLKPFNKFRMLEEGYYSGIFQKYMKETGKNCIEQFNSLYRYNTCRDTIQAAGRVMRKEDDYGVVMFLSDNKKDAEMLSYKYTNANMIVGREMKSWPKV